MKFRVMMVAASGLMLSVSAAHAQKATTNVGNTQKGSVAPTKPGTGSGTQADSARLLATTVKAYPPCQGNRMRPGDASPSVTGTPGGLASPDQVAPVSTRPR